MKTKIHTKLFTFALSLTLTNCSVYRAASNDGVSISDIKKCQHKECFLAKGMEIVDRSNYNNEITEIYRSVARKSGLNYVRAAGHGILDVATLGLWEIVGSPVEGIISNNRGFITAKVKYSELGDTVIEIFDVRGNKVPTN